MKNIITCKDVPRKSIAQALEPYNVILQWVALNAPIPGSHFGEPEAGVISNRIYAREDTPVHSVLHESCHYICMDNVRRDNLHTNAGGDYNEENAVCYLSILLADRIQGFNSLRMMQDMDTWGYTFRLGSAARWFNEDAEDACEWLQTHGITDQNNMITGQLRNS